MPSPIAWAKIVSYCIWGHRKHIAPLSPLVPIPHTIWAIVEEAPKDAINTLSQTGSVVSLTKSATALVIAHPLVTVAVVAGAGIAVWYYWDSISGVFKSKPQPSTTNPPHDKTSPSGCSEINSIPETMCEVPDSDQSPIESSIDSASLLELAVNAPLLEMQTGATILLDLIHLL